MKKISKIFTLGLSLIGGITAVSTPLFLTSCSESNSNSLSFKVLDMPTVDMTTNKTSLNISKLIKSVSKDPISLINGTNSYNNGKYILIYGTVGYSIDSITESNDYETIHWKGTTSPFYKWLIGSTDSNGVSSDEYDKFKNFNISNGFFNWWFNNSTRSNYKNTKILLMIDIPPIPSDNKKLIPTEYCPSHPFQKWNQDLLLNLYKHTSKQYEITFDELPTSWKLLNNTYIRNDESAIEYRRIVEHSNNIRNGVQSVDGGDNKNSGVIAFNGAGNKPMTTSLNDNNYSSLSPVGTPLVNAPDSWKRIYKFYSNEDNPTWPEDDTTT